MIIDLNIILIETDDTEILTARMRLHRNRLLAESDWTQLPDATVDQTAWATYRQQLRDLPSTWAPGPIVEFPDQPT